MAALEHRVDDLEERVDEHDKQLGEGARQFVAVGKDIAHLTEKVGLLVNVLTWVGGAIGLGMLGTAGSALIWVIVHMSKTP